VALSTGTKLGRFELTGVVGAGGMGEVYRARDPRLERTVAIKVIPASLADDPVRLQRFEQEARAAAALNHPNILAVHDIGTEDGSPYIVSELLEGETLRERLRSGRLPVRKAIDYALQIARGLAAAHDKGIVHRDLKPENIFVTRDGRVKILDFGLAKLTERGSAPEAATRTIQSEAGTVLGTVGYMSPEQVRGKPTDARTDLFSFGGDSVRDGLGQARIPWRHGRRHDDGDSDEGTAGFDRHESQCDTSAPAPCASLSREESRGAVPIGAGRGL
jgi:serine/threonine protein kinase